MTTDALDTLIEETLHRAEDEADPLRLPHRSRTELRAAMSDVNSEPLKVRAKAAVAAIEGRGLDLIVSDMRTLIPAF